MANYTRIPPLERFFAKVLITEGCWLWTAGTTRGYPRFFDPDGVGRGYAHIWAYEFFVGPVPPGLSVDHEICDTPLCVNPDHLVAKPIADNVRRARKNTILHNGVCQRGHEMTVENTYVRQDTGQLVCNECRRQRVNAYYANDPEFRRKAIERARRG